jgi:hypothetical protein
MSGAESLQNEREPSAILFRIIQTMYMATREKPTKSGNPAYFLFRVMLGEIIVSVKAFYLRARITFPRKRVLLPSHVIDDSVST